MSDAAAFEERIGRIQQDLARCCPQGTPGMAMYVTDGEHRRHLAAGRHGTKNPRSIDAASRFQMGGLARPILTYLCLRACEQGRMSLESTLEEIVPDYAPATRHYPKISLENLLLNTAGIWDPPLSQLHYMTRPEFCQWFARARRPFRPGAVYGRSYISDILAAEMLERSTGCPLPALLREFIFDPLSIDPGAAAHNRVELHAAPLGALPDLLPPAGGVKILAAALWDVWLTIEEIGRVVELIFGRGRDGGSAELMRRQRPIPNVGARRAGWELLPDSYGLGTNAIGGVVGASAANQGSTLGFRLGPSDGVIVVVALNSPSVLLREMVALRALEAFGVRPSGVGLPRQEDRGFDWLAGAYRGTAAGFGTAWITRSGECAIEFESGVKVSRIVTDEFGMRSVVDEAGGGFPFAPFVDHDDVPGLMIGHCAFKRLGSSSPRPERAAREASISASERTTMSHNNA